MRRAWGQVGLMCLCVLGCKRPAALDDVAIIGIQQEVDSLFIPFKEMLAADEILRAGTLSLTIFDDHWKLVPFSAESIPTLQNGGVELLADGRMRTTWKLRNDVFWPDGTPLTGDDYAFFAEVMANPRQEVIDRTYVEKVDRIEVLGADRKTLVVTWKEPFAYYANFRNFEPIPRHLLRDDYLRDSGNFKKHPYGHKPVLPGPFTVEKWEEGQFISLIANPFITSPRWQPRLKKIVYKLITQSNTMEANLVSGSVDAISPIGLQMDTVLELQKRRGDEFDFHFTEGLQWEHIALNLDDPWLADKRMRHAIMHAIDREALVQAMFQGRQAVAHGFVPPRRFDYHAGARRYPFDPAKSAALLEEMGFRMRPDGIRSKNGEPLRLSIVTTSGNSSRERIEQIIQADLRKVGIDLAVENVPAKILFGEVTRRRKFHHMIMFAWMLDPLKASDTLWRCDYVPRESNGWQGQNYGGWCNEEATRLLKDSSRELDENKRREMSHRMQEIWADELPAIPLYFRTDVSITRKGFKNWKPTGTLVPVTWNAHEWQLSDDR